MRNPLLWAGSRVKYRAHASPYRLRMAASLVRQYQISTQGPRSSILVRHRQQRRLRAFAFSSPQRCGSRADWLSAMTDLANQRTARGRTHLCSVSTDLHLMPRCHLSTTLFIATSENRRFTHLASKSAESGLLFFFGSMRSQKLFRHHGA
jgi:hypothetical protein